MIRNKPSASSKLFVEKFSFCMTVTILNAIVAIEEIHVLQASETRLLENGDNRSNVPIPSHKDNQTIISCSRTS